MVQVSVREARSHLKDLIQRVSTGEEIALTRRGKEVARLVPPRPNPKRFPSLAKFRASMVKKGAQVTESTVVQMRKEERY